MPNVAIPTKCAKCGSQRIRHEELGMGGKHGFTMGIIYRFDVYICEECAYSEFFFKEKT